MPSLRATWRASSTLSGEQQLPNLAARLSGSRQGHTRRVTPMTSTPCSTMRAAATDESTPPLIPATIRSFTESTLRESGPTVPSQHLRLLPARPHDQLDESIELFSRVVRHLDPPCV